jgi:hypothetical protein
MQPTAQSLRLLIAPAAAVLVHCTRFRNQLALCAADALAFACIYTLYCCLTAAATTAAAAAAAVCR